MKEKWDLYTLDRKKTGIDHTRGEILPRNLYHIVVEVWTVIENKRILLTQRHPDKPWGLLWECTGGSILKNESSLEGAKRELSEEIGLVSNANLIEKIYEYTSGDSIYDVYANYQKSEIMNQIKLQATEVVDVKYVSYSELENLFLRGEIIPKLSYVKNLIQTENE